MNALLIGCGSKWGGNFLLPELKKQYKVTLITGSNFQDSDVDVHKVDWNNNSLCETWIKEFCYKITDRHFDLIFFNHNSNNDQAYPDHFKPEGPIIDILNWKNYIYIQNIFPTMLIRALSNNMDYNTKVGLMLTGLIKTDDPNFYQCGLYAAAKYTNLSILRLFSQNHHGIFFGLNPGWLTEPGKEQIKAENISKTIANLTNEHNGKTFTDDGQFWC